MLKNGTHATIAEMSAADRIDESYLGRVPTADCAGAEYYRGEFLGGQTADLQ
jgi:hypothetical protein